MQPTFADIFSGAGLLSAAWARFCRPVHALDLDRDAILSYRRNVAPVCEVGSAAVIADEIRCDVLLAGPPCQGFSTLGRRDPADKRNSLSGLIPRWAASVRATIVVVENVPPFVRTPYWLEMRDAFDRLRYDVQVWTLDAADFGSPQRRVRSFTIASKVGIPAAPAPTHAGGHRTVGEALAPPIRADDPMHVWPLHSELSAKRIALIPPGGDKRDLLKRAPELCPPSWFRLRDQATDVFGRMKLHEPANTIRCEFQNPSKGRYLHPIENRTLSLREGARLQGLSDDWEFVGGRVSVARQIGNGVPIELGEAIARSVAAFIH